MGETVDTLGLSPGRENRPASAGETERPLGWSRLSSAENRAPFERHLLALRGPGRVEAGPSEGRVTCPRAVPL